MTVGELLAVTDNDQRFNLFSGRFGESTYTWYGLLTKKEIISMNISNKEISLIGSSNEGLNILVKLS